jgi:curli biogenesis system outer membrane secretion channel CsgG
VKRSKHHILFGSVVTLILTAAGIGIRGQEIEGDRPIVTVVPFDTRRTSWVPPPGAGNTIAELLGQRLVESGHYKVLDWQLIAPEAAPIEHPDSIARAGERARSAGVDYLVLGSVSRYSKEQKRRSGGGGALFIGMLAAMRLHAPLPLFGGGSATTTESIVGLSVRMINARTGELIRVATAQGSSSRADRSVGGLGAAPIGPFGGGYSSSVANAADAMFDEAARQAVLQAADVIARDGAITPPVAAARTAAAGDR